MSLKVGVIDYGVAGNIRSIEKALKKAGAETIIVKRKEEFDLVDKVVIPGVGSFKDAIEELQSSGMFEALKKAIEDKPVLGICLGMQIMARIGYEFGKSKGLGVFETAEVRKIECDAAVPHMGFNKINVRADSPLFKGLAEESFYFMHSYEVVDYKNVLALANYGNHEFVCAIGKGDVYGVQFHPEKSRDAGIQLFKNFIEL